MLKVTLLGNLFYSHKKDLGYNGNLLGEFLWYTSEDSNDYIFVNFNKENMNPEKNQADREWQIIFYYFFPLEHLL